MVVALNNLDYVNKLLDFITIDNYQILNKNPTTKFQIDLKTAQNNA